MTRDRMFVWFFLFAAVFSNVGTWIVIHDAHEDQAKLKAEAAAYKDEALKSHIQYEGARNDLNNVQRDLTDAQDRLSQAAERERAAKVRASRSRRVVRPNGKVSDPQRPSTHVHASVSTGGLRDITMYCPTGNTTASGKTPRRGMVATISRSIPFGTHILIEGLGEFVVEDRIGHGSEYDLFTPSCAEADRFGRQHRRVAVLS